VSGPSNTSVERAGALLRAVALGDADDDVDAAAVERAREVLEQFRRRFLAPHLELRDELATLAAGIVPSGTDVTARWKRGDRIVDKLVRLPTLRLPQMQDIGGCRAVVRAPQVDLRDLAAAIADRWEVLADDDYVTRPRPSGYRARHVVVRHRGVAIEVQLRNVLQDVWAEEFETLHRNTDLAAQSPETQASVSDFFGQLSRLFARREVGTIHGEAAMQELFGLFVAYKPTLDALHWSLPPDAPSS
jgi:putative GTP pyrophosphokinase